MSGLLEVRDLSLSFGGLKALSDFRITVPYQSLYGLIGPNGAGKTTVFNLLTGVYRPDRGEIQLEGQKVTRLQSYEIAKAGMTRTFQNIRLFGELSVLENVAIGCHLRARGELGSAIFRSSLYEKEEKEIFERSIQLLTIFDLADRKDAQAKNLPYGYQRRLEIARALATQPKVLLLDEPAAGMNPQEKKSLKETIERVRKEFEISILLIEHDMSVVMDICESITVIDHGVILASGQPREIQNNPDVIHAYLGTPT